MPTDTSIRPTPSLPDKKKFQQIIDDKQADLFVLKNKNGTQAAITNYGGRVVSLLVKDSAGAVTDVVVGFDNVEDYQKSSEPYYGAIIGRYGNRIAKGRFMLNGQEYKLAINNGPNALHGGIKGFQYVMWDAAQKNDTTLELHYWSKDGEEGYPGNLQVTVTYTLSEDDALHIWYGATTDKATIINLTNHTYFNLNGQGSGDILQHRMMLNANSYTPIDDTFIPLGVVEPVAGTPFDFRDATAIGARINEDHIQLKNGKGYDHNFVLNAYDKESFELAARATGDQTGIVMEVLTKEPGVQFYTGNFMTGSNTIKAGKRDNFRNAFCLETQHFPNSPNQPSFPTTVLQPGEVYATETIYRFSVIA